VELDLSTWVPAEGAPGLLARAGVLLRCRFLSTPPDLPAPLSKPEIVRDTISASLLAQGSALVDFEVVEAGGGHWLRTVAKARGTGRSMVYLGAMQLHSASCWWLIQMEARETGTTGTRETLVLLTRYERGDAIMGSVAVPLAADEPLPLPDLTVQVRRESSDDPEWDRLVPQHPLSLIRAAQREILASARLSPRALALPPFEGRPADS
jgi:hypothetical protein